MPTTPYTINSDAERTTEVFKGITNSVSARPTQLQEIDRDTALSNPGSSTNMQQAAKNRSKAQDELSMRTATGYMPASSPLHPLVFPSTPSNLD